MPPSCQQTSHATSNSNGGFRGTAGIGAAGGGSVIGTTGGSDGEYVAALGAASTAGDEAERATDVVSACGATDVATGPEGDTGADAAPGADDPPDVPSPTGGEGAEGVDAGPDAATTVGAVTDAGAVTAFETATDSESSSALDCTGGALLVVTRFTGAGAGAG